MESFARRRSQRIYIFAAIHSRTKSTGLTNLRLQAHDLLLQPDHSAQIPFPGLLTYTRDMPTVMLTNACTPLAELFDLDDLYTLCTRPSASVIFKPDRTPATHFDQLPASTMPIFPIERSISVKGLSVRRKQIPIFPAFCLVDYKVQGSTLSAAILDLKNDTARRGQDSHRKYCSLYVQLSRLRSFEGLHLLQKNLY
ncbi:unnamed protein product [Penicillium nalgiovense]|uniref:Uncharacterized protein n=1 Tax=Penicillium nalgiovense TaxID=60175 RepID=A0A9W4HID5_PENNA|nr:unnamed protein product [Penicillium nalgiovense]CAG8005043.1 unnamed protein product [Penicillium nalgiovense]CAG8017647.1 unnamed protein product [Penicillium nalgiovense]CAG8026095.1 unnamed protein product [Penicillium nalgiovense]CAG8035937.1 unnamed protein product [Penicillium nalgiovense]